MQAKGPHSWKIPVAGTSQPTTGILYFISYPGQISPPLGGVTLQLPHQTGTTHRVSCQFE